MRPRTNTAAARCVRLLLHVLQKGRVSTAEATRLLEVSPRLVRDDLQLLSSLAPIVPRGQGRARAWEIDPAAGLGRLGVLDRISLRHGREVASFLEGTALHQGLARAEGDPSEIPERWSRHLDRKIRHLQEPARAYAAHREALDDIVDALLRERTLDFGYVLPERTHQYTDFRPYTLVVYRRAVYLLGRSGEDGPLLRLALDRVRAPSVGPPFAYPEDWDPDAELGRSFGIVASGAPERVVLRFAPRVARLVYARTWHPTAQLAELPGGGVELTMTTAGAELVRFVLEWGATCEVVEPPWLRTAVLAELRGALARYDVPT